MVLESKSVVVQDNAVQPFNEQGPIIDVEGDIDETTSLNSFC